MTSVNPPYRGRFAPSPSGPLHFGSLVAALGSYFQARARGGQWLVRMEDIDPPREMPGAAELILRTLKAHGLYWDEAVMYQSAQSQRYDALLARLVAKGQAYYCRCSRKQRKIQQGDCCCRYEGHQQGAIRFVNDAAIDSFNDEVQGRVQVPPAQAREHFIIRRADGLYAYQLAVVADDMEQGITEVVRGCDLLHTTVWQIALFRALGATAPAFVHLPVALMPDGRKLSKQNHARALDNDCALANLRLAMAFLGFNASQLSGQTTVEGLVALGVAHWQLAALPRQQGVQAPAVAR